MTSTLLSHSPPTRERRRSSRARGMDGAALIELMGRTQEEFSRRFTARR